jgi:hypothetical protein
MLCTIEKIVVLPPMTNAINTTAVALSAGARQRLERGPGPHRTRGFLGPCRIPEFEEGASPGLVRRLAALDSVANGHSQVCRDLFVDLGVTPSAAPSRPAHWLTLLTSRTRERLDRRDQLLPPRLLVEEMTSATRRQPIIFRSLLLIRHLPFGAHQAALLETVQGGIQRPRLHSKELVRGHTDGLGNRIAVSRAPSKRLENQHVERAL